MRILAAHQPNVLPYLGVWEKVLVADVFVWLDDVQFSKGDYMNRVKMLDTKGDASWCTLSVKKPKLGDKINEIVLSEGWFGRFRDKVLSWYRDCMNLEVAGLLDSMAKPENNKLVEANVAGWMRCIDWLGVKTPFDWSSEQALQSMKSQRLVDLCKRYECDVYFSGAGALAYLDVELFKKNDIEVLFQSFIPHTYKQKTHIPGKDLLDEGFVSGLSIVDYMLSGENPQVFIDRCKETRRGCEIALEA